MKGRMLRFKFQYSVILYIIILIPLLFSACSSIPREHKLDDFIIVHTTEEDSPDQLASRYLKHPSEKWRILDYNRMDSLVPGQDIVIPLKPYQLGGITPEGYQIIPVLAYRDFSKEASEPPFEKQMAYLKKKNFQVISLDQLYSFFQFKDNLHEKSVLLIIDSTDQSLYDHAFPILRKYQFPAVVFITPDQVGKEKMLNWEQIARMSENRIQIQCRIQNDVYRFPSDSTFYGYFQKLSKAVEQAAGLMEQKLNKRCCFFLYPPGNHHSLLVHILQKKGFQGAFMDQEGDNPFFTDPYGIHCSQVSRDLDEKKFETLLKVFQKHKIEPISKRLKSVTPAKVGAQKRAENTGFYFSPELQQQTVEIGSIE